MKVEPAPRCLRMAIVYGRMPLPMTRADQSMVAHIIAYFTARGHQVDLFALDTGEPMSERQQQWLRSHCRKMDVVRQSTLAAALGSLRALASGKPLQVGWFTNRSQIARVRRAIASEHYDVVYTYYIRSGEAVRGVARAGSAPQAGLPVTYLAMQLSQSLNTRRIAERATRLRDRLIYTVEKRLVRRYEAAIWKEFRRTVLISLKDVDEIKAACREAGSSEIDNYVLCAHGVDIARFRPRPELEEAATLVFSGVMATNTNIQAVQWFVRNCWPAVKKQVPQARLMIVGRAPATEVQALATAGSDIVVTGEVADPADYIARATICINPMQAGAGMQNKLIEFFASGKAVVATAIANEGIGAEAGVQFVGADAPDAFADAVVALLRDPERRAELGAAARSYIERQWTWEKLFAELEDDMLSQTSSRVGPT